GYFYGDDGNGMYEGPYRQYYAPDDIEYLDPMCQYLFDLSWLEGRAGYGTGFGGPLFRPDPDPALFTSSNRVDYVFSFDARVEGLAEGVTSANLEMQVQLFNSEQTPDKILQV